MEGDQQNLKTKVALLRTTENGTVNLSSALKLIGGISDLNSPKRQVTVKVGVFTTKRSHHTSVPVTRAIVEAFDRAPKIFLAESDNYQGKGSERLQIWKELFTDRVMPFNLSEDTETRQFQIGNEKLRLSHVLFKPNVLVSTHVLRNFDRGSVLKNLFGLVPDAKKSRFHKALPTVLADLYEATGGIDLAIIDGTNLWHAWTGPTTRTNIILVGRDAVAIETVGAALAGLNPQKMPVLQEFAKRSLGETDIDNIQILGEDYAEIKKQCENAVREFKKSKRSRSQSPQTWGGKVNHIFGELVEEGYFKPHKKRTTSDILKALERKGIDTTGNDDKVLGFLARRVKSGTLTKTDSEDGRVYWSETAGRCDK